MTKRGGKGNPKSPKSTEYLSEIRKSKSKSKGKGKSKDIKQEEMDLWPFD